MKSNYLKQSVVAGFLFGSAAMSWSMSAADLQQLQAEGKPITIIDLRNNQAFKNGHIPGAINIPASVISQKTLPPLGKVVAYDDGLGRDSIADAVDALNAKKGIEAEALDGGFAAWETARGTTTAAPGMEREKLEYITYEQLKNAQANDLVLVDLRKPAAVAKARSAAGATVAAEKNPLTDLSTVFPKARITSSPFENAPNSGARRNAAASQPPLYVLIDNGDGSAQTTARALKANGNSRVVILAGGESIIARDGQPGLKRQGFGHDAITTTTPTPQSK